MITELRLEEENVVRTWMAISDGHFAAEIAEAMPAIEESIGIHFLSDFLGRAMRHLTELQLIAMKETSQNTIIRRNRSDLRNRLASASDRKHGPHARDLTAKLET